MRQVLIDAFQLELYERMTASDRCERLAAIAAKSVKEVRYHLRYSSGWLVRLGDGTAESHARVHSALEALWPYTVELFAEDELDRTMAELRSRPALVGGASGVGGAHRCAFWPRRRCSVLWIGRIPGMASAANTASISAT